MDKYYSSVFDFAIWFWLFRFQIGFNTITTAAAAANDTVDEPDGFAKVGDRQHKVADGTSKLLP